jgi:hypothetical protein
LETITQQFNLQISDIASLIAVNDVNGLSVIPIPVISGIRSLITSIQTGNTTTITGNTTVVGSEEIPETTLEVANIPLQGEAIQQLQQLLSTPTATPPNINNEEGGNGGGVAVPPSFSNTQATSYRSKKQYLII